VPGAVEVLAERCTAHDYGDPGKPAIAWDDEGARAELVDALVGDAHRLLGHLPEQELGPRAAEALALLTLVAGPDVEPVEESDGTDGRWRIAQRVAPDRVISTVDPEARHAHKTVSRRQDGFKAHVAVEPETGLITDCALTKASGPGSGDAEVGPGLLAEDPEPVDVLADSAYGSGQARAELADAGHRAVIKPIPLRPAVPGGFTLDDFTVDHAAGTVTCPNGVTRTITARRTVTFGKTCRGCPLRSRCTTRADGRSLVLNDPRRTTTRGTPPGRNPRVPGRLPAASPKGRTQHRLARARQQAGALSRRDQERPLAAPRRRRAQPAPTHHPRTYTRRRRVGAWIGPNRPSAPLPDVEAVIRLDQDAPGKLVVQPRLRLAAKTALGHPARHLTPNGLNRLCSGPS
jgi:hypothetical protein